MRSLAILLASVGLASAHAPPEPPQPEAPGQADGQDERTRLREHLERRLAQVRAIEGHIEDSIAKLDEGADPDEVRREFRPGAFDADRRGQPPDPGPRMDDPERVRAFIGEHLPELADRMAEHEAERPELARRFMAGLGRRLAPIAALEESDPELFGVRLEEFRVGLRLWDSIKSYREAARRDGPDSETATRARDEIGRLLRDQADLRHKAHRLELARVEDRLGTLRSEIAAMEDERESRIRERLDFYTDLSRRRDRWKRDDRDRRGDDRDPPDRLD